MAEINYPILVFPAHALAERATRGGGPSLLNRPEARRQGERLFPQFQRLNEALANRRIRLQGNSLGIEPEQVLVIETVGSVKNFIAAVNKIEGLEWLAEYEQDDIAPTEGFENPDHPNEPLNGQLFIMMTDQRALSELQSLFNLWRRNPEASFAKGLTPFKKAFEHLSAIRAWDVQDRLRETGILEDWNERVSSGQETVPFEAELWYRQSAVRRRSVGARLRQLVEEMDGEVVSECDIENIAYHAILGRIKVTTVSDLLHQQEVQQELALFLCDDIMFLRPVGQCAAPTEHKDEDSMSAQRSVPAGQVDGFPVVALLDGMPLTGHAWLNGRLEVDDPDDYADTYQGHERIHGTAMASLICHDDIDAQQTPLSRPVYVRPILQVRRGFESQFSEAVPEHVLPVDLVHRALVRIFDGEGGDPPASPEVRVVNLSIGNPARPFVREMSGWARLVDWLSWKYNVLFVVSAGNHKHNVSIIDPTGTSLQGLTRYEYQKRVLMAVADDTRNRRLLSPAETLNGLTIGAIHADESGPGSERLFDPVEFGMPSVISAHGPGYRKAIKPEIHLPGGKQPLVENVNSPDGVKEFRIYKGSRPPGQCVATPGQPSHISACYYSRGTSNAAALSSRGGCFFYELLESLRSQSNKDIPGEFDAVLIKTLLVHGADWGDMIHAYIDAFAQNGNSQNFRKYVTRFLGYGQPDFARVATGAEQRVTVIGFGSLVDGQAAEFSLPIPPSLSGISGKRRMTITLAWFSPINSHRQNYRVAHLWFNAHHEIAGKRIYGDHHAVQRGTIQHEVFESSDAFVVQNNSSMTIKVNCREDAGNIPEPVRFGLAVTLEVAEKLLFPIPIYEEVHDQIAVRIPASASNVYRE